MKDIKTFIIGFLTCCCLFLIMGQTENNVMKDIKTLITENGRYQGYGTTTNYEHFVTDTRTGALYYSRDNERWGKIINPVRN